jgi:hypothetical protein
MRKKLIIRAIVATLLWMILIFTFVVDFKTVVFVDKAEKTFYNVATKNYVSTDENVRSVAKLFAIEWATWNGNADDYNKRLGMFINTTTNINLPEGYAQKVVSADIANVDVKSNNVYFVNVLIHAQRTVLNKQPNNIQPVTKDIYMTICVPVKVNDGSAAVMGLPMLVNNKVAAGTSSNYTDFETSDNAELKSFLTQFLQNYYSGNDLTNFLNTGVAIKPVSGWNFEGINDIRTKGNKVYVNITVSADNIKINQNICVTTDKKDNKYFVDSMQPVF